jgi:hypothetical protein
MKSVFGLRCAGLVPVAAVGLLLSGCDRLTAPVAAPAVQDISAALCMDPIVREVAFTAPDAKDVLQVVAVGSDCKQASVLTTIRTATGELVWSRAETSQQAIAFGEATADGETPEMALRSTIKQLADMAEIKTSAEAPDWKEGEPRPSEPTGLFIGTKYMRDEYLAERGANRRMFCHMIYALSTQCVIYIPSDRTTGYATELYTLQS